MTLRLSLLAWLAVALLCCSVGSRATVAPLHDLAWCKATFTCSAEFPMMTYTCNAAFSYACLCTVDGGACGGVESTALCQIPTLPKCVDYDYDESEDTAVGRAYGDCYECESGHQVAAEQTEGTKCWSCSATIQHCAHCSADGVCDACDAGYAVSADGSACYVCNIGCQTCDKDAVCGVCLPGFTPDATDNTRCVASIGGTAPVFVLNTDLLIRSVVLDGAVLDATATPPVVTTTVTVSQCTVQNAGVSVKGLSVPPDGTNTLLLTFVDTHVLDGSIAVSGWLPANSVLRVVNLTAEMKGSTPLFDFRGLMVNHPASVRVQRLHARWSGDSAGGSVLLFGSSSIFSAASGHMLYFAEAVVVGAAHMVELSSSADESADLVASGGLIAFDMIHFLEARAAFLTTGSVGSLAVSMSGLLRFSNITVTGGQPFILSETSRATAVETQAFGSTTFSAIALDGELFRFRTEARLTSSSSDARYTFHHLSVPAVRIQEGSTDTVPPRPTSLDDMDVQFLIGDITVNGQPLTTIAALEAEGLYASALVGAFGEVRETRGPPFRDMPIGGPASVSCAVTSNAPQFVDIAPGVQRAECGCPEASDAPYCTSVGDPIAYAYAYSPAPATCAVAHCDACLFGSSNECGGCGFGYELTATLQCEKLPCTVSHCSSCVLGSSTECEACEGDMIVSPSGDGQCVLPSCAVAHCDACVADSRNRCERCALGYSLEEGDTGACVPTSCRVDHCAECAADDVNLCTTCDPFYLSELNGAVCVLPACGVLNCERCDADDPNLCALCADGFVMDGTERGACVAVGCAAANCQSCTSGSSRRCDSCKPGYWFDSLGGCTVCRAGYTRSGNECRKAAPVLTILVAVVTVVQCALLLFAFLLGWCVCRRWRKEDEQELESLAAFLRTSQSADRSPGVCTPTGGDRDKTIGLALSSADPSTRKTSPQPPLHRVPSREPDDERGDFLEPVMTNPDPEPEVRVTVPAARRRRGVRTDPNQQLDLANDASADTTDNNVHIDF